MLAFLNTKCRTFSFNDMFRHGMTPPHLQMLTIRFFNFNLIQRALVLEDYAPALGVAGFVSRKKGARSKGKEEKEGENNNSR